MADPDESVRAFAAEDAGFDDHEADVEVLADRLRHERARFVRDALVTALSRMTHVGVTDCAIALLDTEDAYLRSAGVTLLQSRGPEALPRLERAYPAAGCDVRKLLLDTAAGVRGEASERLLLVGLDDEDVNVRIAAVEYLGEHARPENRAHFEALVQRAKEPMLIAAALSALEPVGDGASWAVLETRFAGAEGFPRFLASQLLRLMAKWGPENRLGRFFDEQSRLGTASLSEWVDALEVFHDRFPFQELAPEHFAVLRVFLESCQSATSRFRLLKWMGRLALEPTIAMVIGPHLESADALERQGAAAGLARLGSAAARAILRARLGVEQDDFVRATIEGALESEQGARS